MSEVSPTVLPMGNTQLEEIQPRERSASRSRSRSPSHQRLTSEQVHAPPHNLPSTISKPALDRQKVCPMYVRLFCRLHGHHSPAEFSRDSAPTADELIIYTWRDATLAELADLIKEVNIECRRRDAVFDFQLVYADLRGRYCFKPLGKVFNGRKSREEGRTLEEVRFLQGDFIDVAITFGTTVMPVVLGGGVPSSLAGGKRRSIDWSERARPSFGQDKRRVYQRERNGGLEGRGYNDRGNHQERGSRHNRERYYDRESHQDRESYQDRGSHNGRVSHNDRGDYNDRGGYNDRDRRDRF